MSDMPERDLELACARELGERLGQPFETLAEKAARLEAEQGPQPIVRATRYEVSVLPEDDINYSIYAVAVEARGHTVWAVVRHCMCLGRDGEWTWESISSERGDDWLAAHRFDEATALRLAREAAPGVTVNGITAAQVLERHQQREAS